MDDFEKEIKEEFLNEAASLLEDAEQAFLQLEDQGSLDTISLILRLAHNLKGSSRAVGFDQVGEFTHQWETLLLKVKEGEIPLRPAVVNLLFNCLDHVRAMIQQLRADFGAQVDSSALLEVVARAIRGEDIEPATTLAPSDSASLAVSKPLESLTLDDLLAEAAAVKPPPSPVFREPPKMAAVPRSQTAIGADSVRVSLSKLERLIDYVGEMVILQSVLREQAGDSMSDLVQKTIIQLSKVSKDIQDLSMSLRMLPIRPTFQKMQRIVRDTSAALGKEVILQTAGGDTEVDKSVLEGLSDPLVHLIRNCVDHGIESAEERILRGKPAAGQLWLRAQQYAGKMLIEVSDDGGGIDVEKVRGKAVERGLVDPSENLSDEKLLQCIFLPGFSTRDEVTDLSGRGVGMDVVRTNIEAMGGEILVTSRAGEGTTFRILLPLSLAIIESTVVRLGSNRFVIPSFHLSESVKLDAHNCRTTALGEMLLLREENLPILRLGRLFGLRESAQDNIALIVRSGEVPFALVVDDIVGQYQIVSKPLVPELRCLAGVGGSTILGDGRPALILEVDQFASLFKNSGRTPLEIRGVA